MLDPGTPPKACVKTKSGRVETSSASTKKRRPNRLPRTICSGRNGVESRMSQVRGLASWAIAPAMKIGVSRQIRATCPKLTSVNAEAARWASSRSEVLGPSRASSSTTIIAAR
jgi:hypothetical protein